MRIRSLRITSQIFFLILSIAGIFGIGMTGLIYPFFFCVACPGAVANCPIGALQYAVIGFESGAWLKLSLYLFGFIAFLSVIFGRAFCGWACPFGALQDLISPVTKRNNRFFRIPRMWEARYMKYGVLGLVVVAAWAFNTKWFCLFDPGGMVTATIPTLAVSRFTDDAWGSGDYLVMKIIYTIVFLIGIFIISRAWCRFICPYGAMVAPFNKISVLHLKRDSDRCISCNRCSKSCPMNIDVVREERSAECILCGRCVEDCPVSCLDLFASGKQVTKGNPKKAKVSVNNRI